MRIYSESILIRCYLQRPNQSVSFLWPDALYYQLGATPRAVHVQKRLSSYIAFKVQTCQAHFTVIGSSLYTRVTCIPNGTGARR